MAARGSGLCRPEGQVAVGPGGEDPDLEPTVSSRHQSKPLSLHLKMETPQPSSHSPEGDTSVRFRGPGPAQVLLGFVSLS